jgi:hypothetical protein
MLLLGHGARWLLAVLVGGGLAVAGAPPASAAGTVTVTVVGQGSASGEGINCTQSGGPVCSEFYADTVTQECTDTVPPRCFIVRTRPTITLNAGPDSNGFVFDGWTGCDAVVSRDCQLTVTDDAALTVRYRDAQAPSVSAPASGSLLRGDATLTATASDNAGIKRVEFLVQGVLVGSDTSAPYQVPFDTSTFPDGAASVTAKAVDTSDNATTSGPSTVTIDNAAPATRIKSGPSSVVRTTQRRVTVDFTFAAGEPATYQCKLDGLGWAACAKQTSFRVGRGDHVLRVKATDQAGNTDATPAKHFWTVKRPR